jgi:hypothetical protein
VAGTNAAMAKRFYLDTSAYLCILLGQTVSEPLQRELEGAELLSSVLLVLEAGRNLVRLSREGLLTAAEFQECAFALEADMDQFMLRDLTLDLCGFRSMPAVSIPRSLDLAHLHTALWFHQREKLTRFVTLDETQRLSARELGLPT